MSRTNVTLAWPRPTIQHGAHALVGEWLAALVDVAGALELGADRPVGHALLMEPPSLAGHRGRVWVRD